MYGLLFNIQYEDKRKYGNHHSRWERLVGELIVLIVAEHMRNIQSNSCCLFSFNLIQTKEEEEKKNELNMIVIVSFWILFVINENKLCASRISHITNQLLVQLTRNYGGCVCKFYICIALRTVTETSKKRHPHIKYVSAVIFFPSVSLLLAILVLYSKNILQWA